MEKSQSIPVKKSRISLRTALIGMAALSALAFSLTTNHIWEDFFITFRFSKNLFEGNGLVFEPGIRVHGFTSPLGVLLPGVCYFLTGAKSYVPAIWLFRILCIPFYAFSGVLLLSLIPKEKLAERRFFVVLFLLEVKALAFSMNGMETAFMLFFLNAAFAAVYKGVTKHWLPVGLAWAGLMWTRPDSCVYVAVLGIVSLSYPGDSSRKETFFGLLKAAGITTIVYLPWFAWTWWYYETPVPHTIIAKGHSQFDHAASLVEIVPRLINRFAWVYEPVYAHSRNWPPLVFLLARVMAFFAGISWAFPWHSRPVRMASLTFLLLDLYLVYIPYAYPWYYPPTAVIGLFVCALGSLETASHRWGKKGRQIAVGILCFVAIINLLIMAGSWRQLRIQQQVVEFGNRKRVGEWLHEHAAPEDRVYLECLGYIGYFSNCRMRDYPGLCSPEVAELSRQGLSFVEIVSRLEPEWLVLRPHAIDWLKKNAYARHNYHLKAIFNVHPQLDTYGYIPGERMLRFDALFAVYQHIKCPNQAPNVFADEPAAPSSPTLKPSATPAGQSHSESPESTEKIPPPSPEEE